MTPQNEIRIRQWFMKNDTLTVDVVPHDGDDQTTETFVNEDEAIADIRGFEEENDVYF